MSEFTSGAIVQAKGVHKQVPSPEGILTILDDITIDINASDKAWQQLCQMI